MLNIIQNLDLNGMASSDPAALAHIETMRYGMTAPNLGDPVFPLL